MKQSLTLRELESMSACEPARKRFLEIFGQKVSWKALVEKLHELDLTNYEAWLLGQNPVVTKNLLAHGADAKAYDSEALYWAAGNGHEEIVKILLAHGADAKANDSYALYLAAVNGHKEIVKILEKAINMKI